MHEVKHPYTLGLNSRMIQAFLISRTSVSVSLKNDLPISDAKYPPRDLPASPSHLNGSLL